MKISTLSLFLSLSLSNAILTPSTLSIIYTVPIIYYIHKTTIYLHHSLCILQSLISLYTTYDTSISNLPYLNSNNNIFYIYLYHLSSLYPFPIIIYTSVELIYTKQQSIFIHYVYYNPYSLYIPPTIPLYQTFLI